MFPPSSTTVTKKDSRWLPSSSSSSSSPLSPSFSPKRRRERPAVGARTHTSRQEGSFSKIETYSPRGFLLGHFFSRAKYPLFFSRAVLNLTLLAAREFAYSVRCFFPSPLSLSLLIGGGFCSRFVVVLLAPHSPPSLLPPVP